MAASISAAPTQPDVKQISDLAYLSDDDSAHRLDLYLPAGVKRPPLLVFIHGGAWISGNKKAYASVGEYFARRRIAVAVINYRLSRDPAVRHPAHCRDAAAAVHWLQDHAGPYGYDPSRTFLLGHSAGAHMEGILATERTLLGEAKIAGFIGLEGIYDLPALQERFPTYREWFLGAAFGPDAAWIAASPTRRPVISRTPWLVIHSKSDELVDASQSTGWADHLRAAGVTAEYVDADYGKHFETVSVFDSLEETSDEATRILDFISRH